LEQMPFLVIGLTSLHMSHGPKSSNCMSSFMPASSQSPRPKCRGR
jgi:hypothetical protein